MYFSQPRSDAEIKTLTGAWCAVLADTNEDALGIAAAEWLRSPEKYMPTPGWLRERCVELSGQSAQERASNAWHLIAESRYGRDPIADPLVIRCVRELGGFGEIGNTDSDKIHFVRDRFIQKYMDYARRADAFKLLPAGQRERIKLALGAGK